jgi:hypothetical protein
MVKNPHQSTSSSTENLPIAKGSRTVRYLPIRNVESPRSKFHVHHTQIEMPRVVKYNQFYVEYHTHIPYTHWKSDEWVMLEGRTQKISPWKTPVKPIKNPIKNDGTVSQSLPLKMLPMSSWAPMFTTENPCRRSQVPAHLVSSSPLRCHGQDIILEPVTWVKQGYPEVK